MLCVLSAVKKKKKRIFGRPSWQSMHMLAGRDHPSTQQCSGGSAKLITTTFRNSSRCHSAYGKARPPSGNSPWPSTTVSSDYLAWVRKIIFHPRLRHLGQALSIEGPGTSKSAAMKANDPDCNPMPIPLAIGSYLESSIHPIQHTSTYVNDH